MMIYWKYSLLQTLISSWQRELQLLILYQAYLLLPGNNSDLTTVTDSYRKMRKKTRCSPCRNGVRKYYEIWKLCFICRVCTCWNAIKIRREIIIIYCTMIQTIHFLVVVIKELILNHLCILDKKKEEVIISV